MPIDPDAQEEFEEQAKGIADAAIESVGPDETGTFAARLVQPEDDPRYESGTVLGRDAGWY